MQRLICSPYRLIFSVRLLPAARKSIAEDPHIFNTLIVSKADTPFTTALIFAWKPAT